MALPPVRKIVQSRLGDHTRHLHKCRGEASGSPRAPLLPIFGNKVALTERVHFELQSTLYLRKQILHVFASFHPSPAMDDAT